MPFLLSRRMRFLYQFFFRLAGWKTDDDLPIHLTHYIIIAAPHSSNWDFMVGLATRSIMRLNANFLAKKELFIFPFGILFRKLGGFPVDRKKPGSLINDVLNHFKTEPYFVLALAPEGTRKSVEKWKTGFYKIALKANVPIVMAGLDYGTKTVFFSTPFTPCGDLKLDAAHINAFYSPLRGKNRNTAPVMLD